MLEQGQSELIGKIALKWGISIDSALKNIELRTRIKERIAAEGDRSPFLLEADAVSEANNMFWLLSDDPKKQVTEDLKQILELPCEMNLKSFTGSGKHGLKTFPGCGTEQRKKGNGKRGPEKQLAQEKLLGKEKQLPEIKITS